MDMDGQGTDLLPSGGIRDPDREMVFAGIGFRRNGDRDQCVIDAAPCRNREIPVIDPGVDGRRRFVLVPLLPAFLGFGAVGVVVEVVRPAMRASRAR